jgi:type IV pilus assembly protein PilB
MDDPSNEDGLGACREHSGLPVRSMIAPPSDIRSAIRVYYGAGPKPDEAATPPKPVAAAPPPAAKPAVKVPPPAIRQREPSPEPVIAASLRASIEDAPTEDALPPAPVAPAPKAPPPKSAADAPVIEAVEVPVDFGRAERLRSILEPRPTPAPPSSSPDVDTIPRPRGRAPRMVSLTLLDGTTINLPAKRRSRERRAADAEPAASQPRTSEPPGIEDSVQGLTARDLVLALRVVANGADASEVLGSNMRWEALFSALLSLMLKKHIIADWEFIDELKRQI